MKPIALSLPVSIMRDSGALRIFSEVMVESKDGSENCVGKAMWDTGAARSAIAKSIADKIKLKPSRIMRLATIAGEISTFEGVVFVCVCIGGYRIMTPMAVVPDERMIDHEITLGLDFIIQGDFAISRDDDGYPFFSFRFPPLMKIDFAEMEKNSGTDVADKDFSALY